MDQEAESFSDGVFLIGKCWTLYPQTHFSCSYLKIFSLPPHIIYKFVLRQLLLDQTNKRDDRAKVDV